MMLNYSTRKTNGTNIMTMSVQIKKDYSKMDGNKIMKRIKHLEDNSALSIN